MKIMGIDCSTQSLAFGIIEDGELIEYGEYFFQGTDIYKRMLDARRKTEAMLETFDVDYIIFEKAVMVRSVAVALKLAYVFGVVMSVILENSAKVIEVEPITWQSHIGNPVIRGKEKMKLLALHPEIKTKAQTNSFIRQHRKDLTKQWVMNKFGVEAANDNISDAIAIAAFGDDKVVRRG